MLSRLGVAILWLLHFLPLSVLAPLGNALGSLVYLLGRQRRAIARINLERCFPAMAPEERQRIARAHFRAMGRSLLDRTILWWSPKERIQRIVRIEGLAHWEAVRDRPVIWLAPHFVGLDMGGVRLTADYPLISMYSRQKNPLVDRILLRSRTRFGMSRLVSRQDGIRPLVRQLKEGLPFYYLPDQDFGRRDSVFVPFFGVPAATITSVSRLARLSGAVVVPCVTRQHPGGQGYTVRFYPAWDDFPTDDVVEDTRRMNAFIEERVMEMPEQYFWMHRRFKTRPDGEPSFYRSPAIKKGSQVNAPDT